MYEQEKALTMLKYDQPYKDLVQEDTAAEDSNNNGNTCNRDKKSVKQLVEMR